MPHAALKNCILVSFVVSIFTLAPASVHCQTMTPHLERRGAATQLIVDGKPFLMLSGELRNSSSSSLDYMKPLWPRLASASLNTVVTPLSWELVEPVEGKFDFTLLDGLLSQARAQHMHIVFLWLAAWKNGVSSYPPVWVRENTARFPFAVLDGRLSSTLSAITANSAGLREADAKAFSAVMKHIGEVDSRDHTVLMMQVENEVGTLSDTRDRSPAADTAFASAVPAVLMGYLKAHRDTLDPELRSLWAANGEKTAGTWTEIFGDSSRADEIFMAWNYAVYAQAVAAAGKAAYSIPMYVNAWLGGGDAMPGSYPSGGPQPRVIDIWKAVGTALDLCAPDLYKDNFADWADRYQRPDNPLFLPETNGGAAGAAWVFYATGEKNAIGFSPFGIDGGLSPVGIDGGLNGPPLQASPQRPAQPNAPNLPRAGAADLGESYAAIAAVAPILLEQQAKGTVHGFNLTKQHPSVEFTMNGLSMRVSLDEIFGRQAEAGYGLVMMTDFDAKTGRAELLGVGKGFRVIFKSRTRGRHVGIGAVDEGKYVNGAWAPGRRLNGDETDQGGAWRFESRAVHTEQVSIFQY